MIVAAGLSPAWQQDMEFADFTPGEVNRARSVAWYGSGKVLNVGVGIDRLGGRALVIAPLGGVARMAIAAEFADLAVDARWIPTAAATRVCTTIHDRTRAQTTELVENAGRMTAAELEHFAAEFKLHAARAELVVLSGSLAAGTPAEFFSQLLAETKCPAILDLRGPELLAALEHRPLLVKPNREELAATFNRALPDEMAVLAALHELRERGAQWAVVTDGMNPVWVASPEGTFRLVPARVEAV
ncbi:MAG TPA: PfkB family carbohydrate kinase, partial [Pirellulales bacterium]|nr:PfkB family carbohydrate kinase [Pirellulales bacterium]